MRRLAQILLLAAALLAGGAARLRAAFDDLGAGARGPGMGDAFVAVADDVYAGYYNPAGLCTLKRPEFGASYTQLHMGLSDNSKLSTSFAGYAQPLAEGERGTLAGWWNAFALNTSLYREDVLGLSYGRLAFKPEDRGELFLGASMKYLRSGFGGFGEAGNATNGIIRTGTADPLLSGSRSHGALDLDLGALYRFGKHYQLGLQLTHLNRPDMAFAASDSDRLPTGVKLGFNYKSLISNLVAQVDTKSGPGGTRDKNFTLGAERWFPRLFTGDIGVRGAMAIGSREYKQLNLGLSYRTRRFGVDYAFALPIQAIAGTAGSHRFGMSFRFGRPGDEEETLEMLLEAMRQLRSRELAQKLAAVKDLEPGQRRAFEEYVLQSRALLRDGSYKESLDKLSLAMTIVPADQPMLTRFSRLNLVVQHFPGLRDFRVLPVEAALHRGIAAFVVGKDLEAVEKVSTAQSLEPGDPRIEAFMTQLELATGMKRFTGLKAKPASLLLEAKLTEAESALEAKRYERAIELGLEVLREDDQIALAWSTLGTAYFAVRRYGDSQRAWRRALEFEKSPSIREAIRGYLRSIARLKRRAPTGGPALVQPLPQRPKLSSAEVQQLFNEGVDHYTHREFAKARASFEAILQANPNNEEAANALRRVEEELR